MPKRGFPKHKLIFRTLIGKVGSHNYISSHNSFRSISPESYSNISLFSARSNPALHIESTKHPNQDICRLVLARVSTTQPYYNKNSSRQFVDGIHIITDYIQIQRHSRAATIHLVIPESNLHRRAIKHENLNRSTSPRKWQLLSVNGTDSNDARSVGLHRVRLLYLGHAISRQRLRWNFDLVLSVGSRNTELAF